MKLLPWKLAVSAAQRTATHCTMLPLVRGLPPLLPQGVYSRGLVRAISHAHIIKWGGVNRLSILTIFYAGIVR